jgi:succinate dehydrogenase/fumarate reductase flavoprotein subunit
LGEAFMPVYEPVWGDQADVPRIARAMAMEMRKGHAPLYLDMSVIPEPMRDDLLRSKVQWMDYFFRKLGAEAKTDMFGPTPYFALNQMTKMALGTGPDCRSDVPGLLAAGLAQAGCANHFAGLHIGLCIGNGWIAGRSAVEDLDLEPPPVINPRFVQSQHESAFAPLNPQAQAESDRILRELQRIMFACDIGILKHADRIDRALTQVNDLADQMRELAAPHVHELVRLNETAAMLDAARLILGGSAYRTESRVSHFREDYPKRDDDNWLVWVDASKEGEQAVFRKTPIPMTYCTVADLPERRPSRLRKAANIGRAAEEEHVLASAVGST